MMTMSLDAVTVDMTHMTSLKKLPDGFMRGYTSLTSIIFPPNVEELGESVVRGCTVLINIPGHKLAEAFEEAAFVLFA